MTNLTSFLISKDYWKLGQPARAILLTFWRVEFVQCHFLLSCLMMSLCKSKRTPFCLESSTWISNKQQIQNQRQVTSVCRHAMQCHFSLPFAKSKHRYALCNTGTPLCLPMLLVHISVTSHSYLTPK